MIKCDYRALLHRALLAAIFLGSAGLSAADDGCQCREVSLGYTSGHIDGHLRAPFADLPGGEPLRPDFNDLGYDGFHQLNFAGHYDYGRNRFYLHYDRTRLNENHVDLRLRGLDGEITPFTPVVVSSKLDLYRLGYRRLFDTELWGNRLVLAPGAELVALDFEHRQRIDTDALPEVVPDLDFDFIGPGGDFSGLPADIIGEDFPGDIAIAVPTDIDRSYTKTGLRIGAEAEYALGERLSLTAELYDSIPASNWPEIFTAKLGLRFKVFDSSRASLYLFANAGHETLEYENDSRGDDIKAEYRDLIQGGISLSF